MIDLDALRKFQRMSTANQGFTLIDRESCAGQMRHNLASDITIGKYGMRQVVRQMTDIEDYEETTARMRKEAK